MTYDLNDSEEWTSYLEIYNEYIREVVTDKDELKEAIEHINSEDYHKDILKVVNRDNNKFNVCRIYNDDIFIGFCDYICYKDENGKCLIGNFYLYEQYRNHGYGTEVYNIMENSLLYLGGKYIDLTPAPKAVSFYERKGFVKTKDLSLENGEIVYRKRL